MFYSNTYTGKTSPGVLARSQSLSVDYPNMASAATLEETSIIHQQDFPANPIDFYYLSVPLPIPFASYENVCQFWSGFSFLGRKTLEAYDVPVVRDLF